VIFYKSWLWVINRQINRSWQLRRIGDNLITMMTFGQWSEASQSSRLSVMPAQVAFYEALSSEELLRLVTIIRQS
jgi:hypothetical protein